MSFIMSTSKINMVAPQDYYSQTLIVQCMKVLFADSDSLMYSR